jgi:tetratricopeptide (TPR) repeat protein
MDSLITAAARALAIGDPLAALRLVALRNDAAGLALRGIALAQLGDYARARELLRAAKRAFSPREVVARARCMVADAEIAFASRDLTSFSIGAVESACVTLETHGDATNVTHARLLLIQYLLLTGKLGAAESALRSVPPNLSAALEAVRQLLEAGIAMRRVHAVAARAALIRAEDAARRSCIRALVAEVDEALKVLNTPVARLFECGAEQSVRLEDVEALVDTGAFIVDECRRTVRHQMRTISLMRRPVLMMLATKLARAWPNDVARDELVACAFRLKLADDSHRARLRVEIGRLRQALAPIARIEATPRGYVLDTRDVSRVVALAPPVDDKYAEVLALLADGAAWSTSSVAQTLGFSQRSIQRALAELERSGKVQTLGRGRTKRWMTPPILGFATILLLPASPPSGLA